MNSVFFTLLIVSNQVYSSYGGIRPRQPQPPAIPYFGPPEIRRPNDGAPAALPSYKHEHQASQVKHRAPIPQANTGLVNRLEPQDNTGLVTRLDIVRCLKINLEFKGNDLDVAGGYMDVQECVEWCVTTPKCLAVSYEFLLTECCLKSDDRRLSLYYGKESIRKSCVLSPNFGYEPPRGVALPQGWEPEDTVPPLPQSPPPHLDGPTGEPIRPPSYYTSAGGNYFVIDKQSTNHPLPPAPV